MTPGALSPFIWLHREAARIREEAGRDAAKFEALLDDPILAQEALKQFPDSPLLYSMIQEYLYFERLMARRGFFLIDGLPTDAALQRRNDELEAAWEMSQREKDKDDSES